MIDNLGITDPAVIAAPALLDDRNAVQKVKPAASLLVASIVGAALALGTAWPLTSTAQDKSEKAKVSDAHAEHQVKPSSAGDQKHEMGATGGAKKSEWWYDNYTRRRKQSMDGMPGMNDMQGMTKNEMNADSTARKDSAAGMPIRNGEAALMGMRTDDATTMGLGAVGGAGSMNMNGASETLLASSRPGIPGVSHIYHIGATGFFLDHAKHLALSTKQLEDLNVVRARALLSKATSQRRIDEAEQKLWELTGADDPDAVKIQATVQDIEKLRGEQRLALIRSVAEAARGLTEEQRAILLGTKESSAERNDSPVIKRLPNNPFE